MKKTKTRFQITITDQTAAELIKKAAKEQDRSAAKVIARAIKEVYEKE